MINFELIQAKPKEINVAFDLLASAAKRLSARKIDQWQYWTNPPIEKIEWVKNGFDNNEFFFIVNHSKSIMGMVRVMNSDKLYWGKQRETASYIHSLVIDEKYSGNDLGKLVLNCIKEDAIKENVNYLRLDCDATNKGLCTYYEKMGFKLVNKVTLPLSTYNLYQMNIV